MIYKHVLTPLPLCFTKTQEQRWVSTENVRRIEAKGLKEKSGQPSCDSASQLIPLMDILEGVRLKSESIVFTTI